MNGDEHDEGPAFGELLRRYRHAAGMTQAELAEASGVSVRALSNLERGRARAAQRRSTEVLADALGLAGADRAGFLAAAREGRRRGTERAPAPAAGTVLGTLPPAVADLVGRTAELDRLREAADAAADTPGGVVVSVVGQPGVGKTALVQSAAHTLRERFPHGFLSLDLRGMDDQPVTPRAALDTLLRALGVPPARIPATVEGQSALYRSLLAGRRLLVVLDNAADEAQVRPLLSGTAGCLTLITCRRALAGLESARWLRLSPLGPADASALVASIIGPDRVAAEPGAAAELVELCGHLPLAVRIAGNRLASRPDWSLAYLVTQLRDEHTRLAALAAGDLRVRPAFEISHRRLSPAARLVFRRAAVVPGPDFGAELAAVATGLPEAEVQAHLDELVDANILLAARVAGRYAYHDLIRLYAGERLAAEEDQAAAEQARARVWDHLLTTAVEAGRLFLPNALAQGSPEPAGRFTSRAGARAWLDAEAGNWLAAQRAAARAGQHRAVLDLAKALHWFSDGRMQQLPWDEVAALGLAAARALGSRAEEAAMLNSLGWARYYCLGDNEAGREVLEQALALSTAIGDRAQQTWALAYLGAVLMRLGRSEEGLDRIRRAVAMSGELGFWLGQGTIRNALGQILCAVGRPDEGLAVHRAVLADAEFSREQANPETYRMLRSFTLLLVGRALEALEDWPQAAETHQRARALFATVALPLLEADSALHEGMAWRRAGRQPAALAPLRFALSVFTGVPNRWERAQALAELAAVLEHQGDTTGAAKHRREAVALCEDLGTPQARQLAERLADPKPRPARLSDRLQAARNQAFTGRAEELAFLRTARQADPPPFSVLWLHGPGGVGKTTLLQRFVDDAVADGESCVLLDARMFEPTPQAFADALGSAEWPAGLRLLVLDTAELLAPLERWLRESFLLTAPEGSLLVVAGRDEPGADWRADGGWWRRLRTMPVRDLPPADAAELLRRRGIPEHEIPAVLRFTSGHPLALALVADVAGHRTGDERTWDIEESSDVVAVLLRRLMREVPSDRHREALEVLALARVTTGDFLRHCLSEPPRDVEALFEWLRGLSFVETTAEGLVPHPTARQALLAGLRDRPHYEQVFRRVHRHVAERLLSRVGDGQRNALDYLYLSRYGALREYFLFEAVPDTRAEPAAPADRDAVLKLIDHNEGPQAARLAEAWWRAQPDAFTVFRRRGGGIDGLLVQPRLAPDTLPVPDDPVARAALAWAERTAPLRPGQHLLLGRWIMGQESYQELRGSGMLPTACALTLRWTTTPGTALSYTSVAEGAFWAPVFEFIGHRRLPEITDADGRRCTPFVFDWRQTPPREWFATMEDRQLASQVPPGSSTSDANDRNVTG
ncbi:AAA ATPase domain-containing protein [Amycolatopsis sacchari]|uniref:AAA ATPase domain-containing protein n=1 Tax=Amycolatopsis sacchari TaxID=115433 RepID=A0A1I3K9B7_9PSEU|nr:AAA family ATPase [Amycolatopsis sacchari]SFI69086.1 AAA ATPase domain-containing protein [Amycolatopsis sacchari]